MHEHIEQKKVQGDYIIKENKRITDSYSLIILEPTQDDVIDVKPGQFVQVLIPDSPTTFLRRPISVCDFNTETRELSLLVRKAGAGTSKLCSLTEKTKINLVLPLGNGFSLPNHRSKRLLLIGGGVGVAPLLYFGKYLRERGYNPSFLLGARTKQDLLLIDDFREYGELFCSTEDGSYGEKGLITYNNIFNQDFNNFYCCGPVGMMKAITSIARQRSIDCEVSLENMMACGVGACLCCVEKTVKGNVCVCTEGPVFNTNLLNW